MSVTMDSTQKTCPDCGGEIRCVSDVFRGSAVSIDNFEEARESIDYDETPPEEEVEGWKATDIPRDEWPEWWAPEEPYITDSIVVSEQSCEDCDWSARLA
ncbi:MAG: hypothetical protein ACI9CA_000447 [Natronomonas sp.]|jgi:hypothetical protein